MPRSLQTWLEALEQRSAPDYTAAYAEARERLEAKLLSMPYDGPELTEEEGARVVASLLAELRAHIAERNAR
jgi:hypothetical protein